MDKQDIIDSIMTRLDTSLCEVKVISLNCSVETLTKHIKKDVEAGHRTVEMIEESIRRLPLYNALNSIKIDVSTKTPEEVAEIISRL